MWFEQNGTHILVNKSTNIIQNFAKPLTLTYQTKRGATKLDKRSTLSFSFNLFSLIIFVQLFSFNIKTKSDK